ncbi:MAG: chitobiase/beta-hexosaminidase C-terminal domain-containing protein [archaeon]
MGKFSKILGLVVVLSVFAAFAVGVGFSVTELKYDDGTIGYSGTWLDSDGQYVVKFAPAHKGEITWLGAYVSKDGSDDEWWAGLLNSDYSTLSPYVLNYISGSSAWRYASFSTVVSSPFYAAVKLQGSDDARLGKDGSSTSGYSEANTGSGWSAVSGNHMIRAYIDYFPEASSISFSENPTSASSVTVYATCTEYDSDDDVDHAQVRVDGGSWDWMSASDGSFNENSENAYKTISISGLSDGDHTVEVRCEDENSNWGDPVSATLTKGTSDTTAPVTTDDVPSGWKNTDVTVTFTCTDSGSGCDKVYYTTDGSEPDSGSSYVDSASSWQFTMSSEGQYTIKYRGVDVAGNWETTKTAANLLSIDKTAPGISGAATEGPNGLNGWYVSDVTVRFDCTDDLSGPVESFFDIFMTTDGAGQSASGTCYDLAGNSAGTTVSNIDIDKTVPSISGTVSPSPNGDGWNKEDATVHFDCSDATSGISSCTSDVLVTTEGETLVTGTAIDNAGNSATADITVKLDKTDPVTESSFNPAAPNGLNGWYVTEPEITLTFTDADPSSGKKWTKYKVNGGDAETYSAPFALPEGIHELKFHSKDRADNTEGWNTISNIKVDTTAPEAPEFSGTSPYYDGDGDFYVSWSSSSDATSGIRGYALYRSLNEGSFVLMGVFLDTTYHEQSPGIDSRYGYKVSAIDNAGNEGAQSEEKVVVVDRMDPTAPLMHDLPPYIGETEVTASWDHAADTGVYPSGISTYDVYVNSALDGSTTYPDNDYYKDSLANEQTYLFKTNAWDKSDPANEGPMSNEVGTTVDLTDPVTTAIFNPETPNGNNGWYISRPSITLSAVDSGSGVYKTYYCFDQIASGTSSLDVETEETEETGDNETVEGDRWHPTTTTTVAPTPCTPSAEYTGPFQIDTEGTNYVRFYSVDNVGNVETVNEVSFKQDLNEPTNQWFFLNGGNYYSDDSDVGAWYDSGKDTSKGSGLDYCVIDWGDDSQTTVSKSSNHVHHTYADGEYTASYVCYDNAGHSSEPETDEIFVDTVDPATSAALNPAEPDGDNGWYVSEVEVALTATDPEPASGIYRTYYCVDQIPDGSGDDAIEGTEVDGDWGWHPPRPCTPNTRYTHPFDVSDDGTNYVRFYSVDKAGNEEETQTISFKQDETNPETDHSVSPRNPDGDNEWYVSEVDVTLDADDDTSGVYQTLYCVKQSLACEEEEEGDGEPEPTWWHPPAPEEPECEPDTLYDGTFTVLLEGKTSVTYMSIDNAGNEEEMHTFSFKQDWTDPTTTATTDPSEPNGNNSWFNSTVQFNLTAVDGRAETPSEPEGETIESGCFWWWWQHPPADGEVPCTSGVHRTYYCIDYGAETGVVGCSAESEDCGACYPRTRYTEPLNLTYEGLQTIRFFSVDKAGNREGIQEQGIWIDTVAPESTITAPANMSNYSAIGTLVIRGNSSDETSEIFAVEVVVKNAGGYALMNWTASEINATGDWNFTWTPGGYGTYYISSRAIDAAGNFETEPEEIVVYFPEPPLKVQTYGGFYVRTCGNGVCNANIGENERTCPEDCKAPEEEEPLENAEELVNQVTTTTVQPTTTTTVQPQQGTLNPRPGMLPTGRFVLFDLADQFWQWLSGLMQ